MQEFHPHVSSSSSTSFLIMATQPQQHYYRYVLLWSRGTFQSRVTGCSIGDGGGSWVKGVARHRIRNIINVLLITSATSLTSSHEWQTHAVIRPTFRQHSTMPCQQNENHCRIMLKTKSVNQTDQYNTDTDYNFRTRVGAS